MSTAGRTVRLAPLREQADFFYLVAFFSLIFAVLSLRMNYK